MKESQLKKLIESIIREIDVEDIGKYTFHDFGWIHNMAGFGVPSDVKYGSVYLGTIESVEDGYKIVLIDTPHGNKKFPNNEKNKFKTKNLAAEFLHKAWLFYKTGKVSK